MRSASNRSAVMPTETASSIACRAAAPRSWRPVPMRYASWGRWTDGVLQPRGLLAFRIRQDDRTLSSNDGVHYLVGVPSTTVPTQGEFGYALIGATSPTISDGSVSPGRFTGAARWPSARRKRGSAWMAGYRSARALRLRDHRRRRPAVTQRPGHRRGGAIRIQRQCLCNGDGQRSPELRRGGVHGQSARWPVRTGSRAAGVELSATGAGQRLYNLGRRSVRAATCVTVTRPRPST